MFREKLITTLMVSIAVIGGAMLGDYVLSIVILGDPAGYTPLVTLCISTTLTIPVTYGLVSGRVNLRLARDALAAARDEALQASHAKSEFLANMSHELRTPLNAILGFSEMLRADAFADRRVEYADLIHSSGSHLLGLVNDLLDLSRIEARKLELRDDEIDVEALFAECATIVAPQAAARAVVLGVQCDRSLPLVMGDRRALLQVLLNLLNNAIKFTGPGQRVTLFAQAERDGGLTLGVKDHGIGIAEDEQARVFERFGQSRHDIAQGQKGTGLGLPIVKGLVEAHGGRVALESQPGQGTCVTLWLPPERLTARPDRVAA